MDMAHDPVHEAALSKAGCSSVGETPDQSHRSWMVDQETGDDQRDRQQGLP